MSETKVTKIDIISGFLGAGKTTLIKKLISECFEGQQVVLIENEFGEIAIDGGFLKEAGIQINEISSGCICCSLVGQFDEALCQMVEQYHPDRVIIEPSGVGKLSDVSRAAGEAAKTVPVELGCAVAVVDAKRYKSFFKNFGEFYSDQIRTAGTIILSRTQLVDEAKLSEVVSLIREQNPDAAIITTPWDQIDGDTILAAMAHRSLAEELMAEGLDHDHDEDECDDPDCECHHHHHDHDHDEHGHHHHEHGEGECDDPDCECHEHHHAHDHDEHYADKGDTPAYDHAHKPGHDHAAHDHDEHHHHHHGHDADEIFTSWGAETPKSFTKEALENALNALDGGDYGTVLRAKGIVPASGGGWYEFDMVPGEFEIREGAADYTGRLCVIGSELKEEELPALFGL